MCRSYWKIFAAIVILSIQLGNHEVLGFPLLPTKQYDESTKSYPKFTSAQRWTGEYPNGCRQYFVKFLRGEDLFICSQQLFWEAFQYGDYKHRRKALHQLALMSTYLAFDRSLSKAHQAQVSFQRGLLQIATMIENKGGKDLKRAVLSLGDFEIAHQLSPVNYKIEIWNIMVRLFAKASMKQSIESDIERIEQELLPQDFAFILFAMIPAYAGLPLSSGLPQKAGKIILENPDLCADRSDCFYTYAPYSRPGADFTFGEVFARLGDAQQARRFLERSLSYPESATWVNRDAALQYLAELESRIARFTAIPNDEDVIELLEENTSETSCMKCHQPMRSEKSTFPMIDLIPQDLRDQWDEIEPAQ